MIITTIITIIRNDQKDQNDQNDHNHEQPLEEENVPTGQTWKQAGWFSSRSIQSHTFNSFNDDDDHDGDDDDHHDHECWMAEFCKFGIVGIPFSG